MIQDYDNKLYDELYGEVFPKGALPTSAIPSGFQLRMFEEYIKRNKLRDSVMDYIVNFRKAGDMAYINNSVMSKFVIPFPKLIKTRFEGVTFGVAALATAWPIFPFDTAVNGKTRFDGCVFGPAGVSLPAGCSLTSGVVHDSSINLDVSVVDAAVNFCQLAVPLQSGDTTSWTFEDEVEADAKSGFNFSPQPAALPEIDILDYVEPLPKDFKKSDKKVEPFVHVYDQLKSMLPAFRRVAIRDITKVKWVNTLNHKEYSQVYKVKNNDLGYIDVIGRNCIAYLPISPDIGDHLLFQTIQKQNKRAAITKMFMFWYYGMSFGKTIKEVVESVRFVKAHGCTGDLIGMPHAGSFASTWTASKFGNGPTIVGNMVMPAESAIKSRPHYSAGSHTTVFFYIPAVGISKVHNFDARTQIILTSIKSAMDTLKKKGYEVIFIRCPLFFLEVDSSKEFLSLKYGFVLDSDPLSDWIWVTNDKAFFGNKKTDNGSSYEYSAGSEIRATLRECCGARFMVDQTHSTFIKRFVEFGDATAVVFKSAFEAKVQLDPFMGSSLIKLDEYIQGKAPDRPAGNNPFAALDDLNGPVAIKLDVKPQVQGLPQEPSKKESAPAKNVKNKATNPFSGLDDDDES
jgi:hypothetical protein